MREHLQMIQTATDIILKRKGLSRAEKEERIAELYSMRTNIYKRVLPIMREHYNNWKQSQQI